MQYETKTKLIEGTTHMMVNVDETYRRLIPSLQFSLYDFINTMEPDTINLVWGDDGVDTLRLHPEDKYDPEKLVLYALLKKFVRMRCDDEKIPYYNNITVKLVNYYIKKLEKISKEAYTLGTKYDQFQIRLKKKKAKKLEKRRMKNFIKSKKMEDEGTKYIISEQQLASMIESVLDKYFIKRKDNTLNE
jgi:hypothetical protein